jgi:Rieske Fe-S protein
MTASEVSRRAVLQGTGVAVGAGIVGAVGYTIYGPGGHDATYGGPAPTSGGSATVLAPVTAVPDGGGIVLTKAQVVLTRTGNQIAAFSAVCTHQSCLVDRVRAGLIVCPCHGSTFDARTGAVRDGPAGTPLPAVPIAIVNGSVVKK